MPPIRRRPWWHWRCPGRLRGKHLNWDYFRPPVAPDTGKAGHEPDHHDGKKEAYGLFDQRVRRKARGARLLGEEAVKGEAE